MSLKGDEGMFHKAISLAFKEGTVLELTFQTGEIMKIVRKAV